MHLLSARCAIDLAAAREREKAIAGFLQAVRNRAMAQPPLANEGLAAPLDLLRGLGVDHVGVVGADLVVQALRRMRKQVPMFVHRAALHRRVLPDGGNRLFEARCTVDDEELRSLQAALDQVVENRAPGFAALSAPCS